MSANNGNGQRGPPDNAVAKGVKRDESDNLVVSDDPLKELQSNVNWNNLSPFEQYVLAILDENDMLQED